MNLAKDLHAKEKNSLVVALEKVPPRNIQYVPDFKSLTNNTPSKRGRFHRNHSSETKTMAAEDAANECNSNKQHHAKNNDDLVSHAAADESNENDTSPSLTEISDFFNEVKSRNKSSMDSSKNGNGEAIKKGQENETPNTLYSPVIASH